MRRLVMSHAHTRAEKALHPLALWCLDTFDDDHHLLVGVELGADAIQLFPIELCPLDPITDLRLLRAPESWDAAIVIADVLAARLTFEEASRTRGRLAHAGDHLGHSATILRGPDGHDRPLSGAGRLHGATAGLFLP